MVGLGAAVPRAQRLKQVHQSVDAVSLFKPVTKYSAEVDAPEAIAEVLAGAFRTAESGRPGAAFVSLPMDVMVGPAPDMVLAPVRPQELGAGPAEAITDAAQLINQAKIPVLLLGMQASEPANATLVRALLEKAPLPCVCTYQGAGIFPRSMLHLFAGRVGLFNNQPADQLLDQADLVITVGYDPIEYDENLWNHRQHRSIVHIDNVPSDIDVDYRPRRDRWKYRRKPDGARSEDLTSGAVHREPSAGDCPPRIGRGSRARRCRDRQTNPSAANHQRPAAVPW